ncbi:hypothetical protein [Demequina rhizosphaerae]|uniref:hypothetical protein n=1 Tax=Demequina rhizosphaerae TaxID=1638985 RepID=UPI000785A279|nr:hypothetical protein [Demequina rhizosphaerae]
MTDTATRSTSRGELEYRHHRDSSSDARIRIGTSRGAGFVAFVSLDGGATETRLRRLANGWRCDEHRDDHDGRCPHASAVAGLPLWAALSHRTSTSLKVRRDRASLAAVGILDAALELEPGEATRLLHDYALESPAPALAIRDVARALDTALAVVAEATARALELIESDQFDAVTPTHPKEQS